MVGKGNFIIIEREKALLTHGGMGLLWYYKKKFKDFILSLEWKVSNRSDNSGVFVRFPNPFTDLNIAIEYGYEIQIDDIGSPDGIPSTELEQSIIIKVHHQKRNSCQSN